MILAVYQVKLTLTLTLDSLLFELVTTPEKKTSLLAIPETCVNKIITLCHSSLFTGQQTIIKTYLIIGGKFFIPWCRFLILLVES